MNNDGDGPPRNSYQQPTSGRYTQAGREQHLEILLKEQEEIASTCGIDELIAGFSAIVQFILQAYCNIDLIDLAAIKWVNLFPSNNGTNILTIRKSFKEQNNNNEKKEDYYVKLFPGNDISNCPIFALTIYSFLIWHTPPIKISIHNFNHVQLVESSAIIRNIFKYSNSPEENTVKPKILVTSADTHHHSLKGNINENTSQKNPINDNDNNVDDDPLVSQVFPWLKKLKQDMTTYDRTNFRLFSFCSAFEFFAKNLVRILKATNFSSSSFKNIFYFICQRFPQVIPLLEVNALKRDDSKSQQNLLNRKISSHTSQVLDNQIEDIINKNKIIEEEVEDMKNIMSSLRQDCEQIYNMQLNMINNLKSNQNKRGPPANKNMAANKIGNDLAIINKELGKTIDNHDQQKVIKTPGQELTGFAFLETPHYNSPNSSYAPSNLQQNNRNANPHTPPSSVELPFPTSDNTLPPIRNTIHSPLNNRDNSRKNEEKKAPVYLSPKLPSSHVVPKVTKFNYYPLNRETKDTYTAMPPLLTSIQASSPRQLNAAETIFPKLQEKKSPHESKLMSSTENISYTNNDDSLTNMMENANSALANYLASDNNTPKDD